RLDGLAGRGGPGGLDLARFVVGSEGTLVAVVAAEVALVPVPRHRVIAVGHFASTEAAIEATGDALACQPAAVELIDRAILELARTRLEYRQLSSILTGDPQALLFVTFFGDTEAEAAAALHRPPAAPHCRRRAPGGSAGGGGGGARGGLGGVGPPPPRPPRAAGVRRARPRRPGGARPLPPPVPGDPARARAVRGVLRSLLGGV